MRFNELDTLRFLAAVGVMLYHYTARRFDGLPVDPGLFQTFAPFSRFGYLGVNLFFMISGFVILASAYKKSCYEFAVSRATRLYPTYWTCVLATVLAVLLLEPAPQIGLGQLLANLTMLNDYVGIEDIDGVYWTLQAELKFYGCVFLLLLFDWFKHFRVWITVWLLATVSYTLWQQPFFMGWFITPFYSSYFIAGVVFYLATRDGFTRYHTAALATCLVLSATSAYSQIDGFMNDPQPLQRYVAVLCVLFFYAIFLAIATGKLRLKHSGLLFLLGGLTYPLYLLHNRAGKALFDLYAGVVNPYLLLLGVIGLVMALSYCVHTFIEQGLAKRIKTRLLSSSLAVKSAASG